MESRFARLLRCCVAALMVVVLLAMFPHTPSPTEDIKILAYEFGAFLLLALWLFLPRTTVASIKQPLSVLLPLFAAFLALHIVASWWSPNAGYSFFRECTKLAALFIVFWVTADLYRTPGQAWRLISVLCLAVSVTSIYGIMQSRGLDMFPWDDVGRSLSMVRQAPATFGNQNLASHVVGPTLVLALGLMTQRRGRWALLCIVLFAYHLSITQTRGTLTGLLVAGLVTPLAVVISRKITAPGRAIAVTFGCILVIIAIGVGAVSSVSYWKTGQPYPEDISITLRYHSFNGACRMIQDRPWFGHGPGMYQVVNPEYWTPLERERFSTLNRLNERAHSEPLEIAVNAGLPAAILYFALVAFIIYSGLSMGLKPREPRQRPLGFVLAAFFLVFFTDSLVNFNFYVPASGFLFFLFAGVTAGVWRGTSALGEKETADPTESCELQNGKRSKNRWIQLPLLVRFAILVWASSIPIIGARDFVAKYYHQYGVSARHHEAYADADVALQKAMVLAPYDWLNPYFRGIIARDVNHAEAEVEHLAHTLDLNPGYLHAQFRLAEATFNLAADAQEPERQALLQATVEQAERAAHFNPLSLRAHDLLGRASFLYAQSLAEMTPPEMDLAMVAWRDAEENLLRAIQNGSVNEEILYCFVALARMELDDPRGAQRALIKALDVAPENLGIWHLFMTIAERAHYFDALRTSLDWHIQQMRSTTDEWQALHLMRANVLYWGYGDEAETEEVYRDLVRTSPDYEDAWAAFHSFAMETDRHEAFFETLEQVLPDSATDRSPLVVQAVSDGLQHDEERLVDGVRQLLRVLQEYQAAGINDDEPAPIAWAANALARAAENLELSEEHVGHVFLNLGLVLSASHDEENAIQLFERALPFLSGDHRLLGLLRKGEGLLTMDRVSEAVEALDEAARAFPNSFEARDALADALVRNGEHDQARLELLRILATFSLSEERRHSIQRRLDSLRE